MKVICVAGSSSGAGKTAVACALLRRLPGWGALKVTRCHPGGGCPRGRPCGVCAALDRPYRLLEMTSGNDTPGKDTDRLRRSGAGKVLWLMARPEALRQGLRAALLRLRRLPGVVVEGNSAVPLLKADLVVMVRRRGRGTVSPSARAALRHADEEIVVSGKAGGPSVRRIEAECRRITARLGCGRRGRHGDRLRVIGSSQRECLGKGEGP